MKRAASILFTIGHILSVVHCAGAITIGIIYLVLAVSVGTGSRDYSLFLFLSAFGFSFFVTCLAATILGAIGKTKVLNDPDNRSAGVLFIVSGALSGIVLLLVGGILHLVALHREKAAETPAI